ncbi:Similar to kh: Kynurenine 3-monooxygenase (Anopheles gambiae) [Cotesia congregata]|uniref:Kynurenine 3-monooxygenase n=1 Tax=Cotesia congregata TaxID=51543 RepID=A0A8J2MZN3_COTCN|nr:Similar to kh: Kynurenine 3-monooxygenase (Anopheles gambiae) [Cotesia congregata]
MKKTTRGMDIIIVGGGLVGGLAACALAKRGHRVRVYEYRSDIRIKEARGQSIDLSLSYRGRQALKLIDLEDKIVNHHGISMRGRMLHGKDGSLKEMIYDSVKKNTLYSVSRLYMNQVLLDAADEYPSVTLFFNHKLLEADLDNGKLKFSKTNTQEVIEVEADLIIGADGAHSTVRKMMLKRPGFDFSQTYIEHGYVELNIPPRMIDEKNPERGHEFCMSSNHLHIWPRGTFMMIAMPNDDHSFTGNIFAPLDILNGLDTPKKVIDFFTEQFPDVVPLIGSHQTLVDNFFMVKPKSLISIKCNPYHMGKSIILGDAAHAMVPFYAQGMNAAFEDVVILNELMDLYNEDMSKVLPAFSKKRCADAHAICDLAMYNYIEMRELVLKKSFLMRRTIDTFLHWMCPDNWLPLYNSIHFSRMGFRDCVKNRAWQDKILQRCMWFLFTAIALGILFTSLNTAYWHRA